MSSTSRLAFLAVPFVLASLAGCAAVSVASTAVGLAATAASVTVDAAVGTAKVVGGAVSAAMPSKGE